MTAYPEYDLGAMMDLRYYQRLEERVSKYVEEQGWSFVIEALEKGRNLPKIIQGKSDHFIPIREGILRDGMIALLKLEDFKGLDVDFAVEFSDLKGDTIEDLRAQARERAVDLLVKQVKRGNTFFLELEVMKEDERAVHVPDVIDARNREMESLAVRPPLYQVFSTYYGFSILTAGGLNSKYKGVPETIEKELVDILGKMDLNDFRPRRLKFTHRTFSNCSSYQRDLLWNLLILGMGEKESKHRALEILGALGDSRALDFLHLAFETDQDHLDHEHLKRCIGRIGHPSSYEIMKERSRLFDWSDMHDLFTIAGIRHPKVIELVSDHVEKFIETERPSIADETLTGMERAGQQIEYNESIIWLIEAMSRTRLRRWFPYYEKFRKPRPMGLNTPSDAVFFADRNIHPPFDDG